MIEGARPTYCLLLLEQISTRTLNRVVRLAHLLLGFGTHLPPEAEVWTELAPARALRRIAQQTEEQFALVAPLRRPR